MNSFLVALQFLTRIPITLTTSISEDEQSRSILYYAPVGLVIGLLLCGTAWISGGLEHNIVAALVLAVWIGVTGALHLDGLSDSADAWVGGYGNKDKTLAIMKDPYCGPAGVVVLVVLLLLKFTLLSEVVDEGHLFALLIAPAIARFAASWLFQTTPYVREQGLGSLLTATQTKNHYTIYFLVIAISLFWALGFSAVVAIAILLLVYFGLRRLMLERLDGITGDTTGAMIEIIEMVVLFVFIIFG